MSAPIQASASVQVVPASNCVRSSTRMPARQPGDAGATGIVRLLVEMFHGPAYADTEEGDRSETASAGPVNAYSPCAWPRTRRTLRQIPAFLLRDSTHQEELP